MSANRIISSCIVAAALACTPAKPDPVLPPPPAVVNSFTATPKTITGPGQMVTLAWDTSDANRVMLEQVGKGQLEIDGTKPNGSLQVTVNADTTFVLTAIGEGGTDSAVQGVTLVGGGEMLLFDATSKTLDPGATTTLVWNAPGADAVTIKDASGAALDLKGQVSSGSLTVAPGASTHYDLEAGARTARVDVVVLPAIFSFTTSPSVAPGQPLQLSWRTSGGTKLTLTREGVGTPLKVETDVALVKNGGFTDTVPMNLPADGVLSYRLVLEDGPNHVENSAIARVAGSLKITRFTVPAYVRVGAPYSVSWATAGANSLELLVDGQVVYVAPDPVLAASSSATLPALSAPSARVQLRVKNDRGGELTEQRDITTVGLPTFVSFSADKTTIASGGEAVMVSWNVVNARDVRITQSGAGTVYAATGALDTGAVAVYPNQPITVLTLTATNGAGDGVAPATVTVAVTSLATLTFDRLLPAGALANVTGHTVVGGAEVWGLPTVAKNAPGEAWVDIQSTGFLVNHVTDASSALTTLPEPVDTVLYGRRVSMGSISTSPNGWFFFSPTTFDGPNTNGPIGSTFPALAVVPYFKDLFSVTGSEVYGRFDSVGSDRRFIIQWVDWEDRSYAGSRLSFQAQVFSSGKVVFAYGKLQGVTVADGAIGVFNGSQNQAITATSAPVVGDTFTFFASPATLPTPLRIESAPYQAKVSVGGGFIQVFGDGRLQPGELAISEINPRPAAGVTNGEWVELTNFSNKTINLNGWTLSSGSATHNIATDVMLPPNSVSVLAQATDLGDATSGVVATYVYPATFAMADASGTLTLQFGTATYESASWDSTSQTGAGVSVRVDRLQPSVLYTATPVCSGATTGSYGLQTGTPGQMQPRCTTAFPYTVRQLPVGNFESIAATGTLINAGADTALNTVTLTNPIQYFGAMSTSLTVSSNGVLSTIPFTASTATNKSAASTSLPVGTIAPFWDDLTATPGTGVGCYWQAKDPDGTPASGDEYTIVSWEGYKTVSSATGLLNFQVKFFANGNIEYHYGAMNPGTTGAAHQGSGATTWLEDPTGKSALAVNVNSLTPGIAPSSAWRFTYAP